jgi:hypothetical protein
MGPFLLRLLPLAHLYSTQVTDPAAITTQVTSPGPLGTEVASPWTIFIQLTAWAIFSQVTGASAISTKVTSPWAISSQVTGAWASFTQISTPSTFLLISLFCHDPNILLLRFLPPRYSCSHYKIFNYIDQILKLY